MFCSDVEVEFNRGSLAADDKRVSIKALDRRTLFCAWQNIAFFVVVLFWNHGHAKGRISKDSFGHMHVCTRTIQAQDITPFCQVNSGMRAAHSLNIECCEKGRKVKTRCCEGRHWRCRNGATHYWDNDDVNYEKQYTTAYDWHKVSVGKKEPFGSFPRSLCPIVVCTLLPTFLCVSNTYYISQGCKLLT